MKYSKKKKLRFIISSYNEHHKPGEPRMIEYDEIIEVNADKSFYHLIMELTNQYMIKAKDNIEHPTSYIFNMKELLWDEYFNKELVNNYLMVDKEYHYTYLDLPIGGLDEQFHICNKIIKLSICCSGLGLAVGKRYGIKFYFHTNEKDRHHRPHIHCCSGSKEFRIDLEKLQLLDDPFKSKQKTKVALKLVSKNQKELLAYWNKVVINGETLKFEINY